MYLKHDPGYIERAYRHEDDRGRFRVDNLTAAGQTGGSSGQPWRGVKPYRGRHWAVPTVWPTDIKKPTNWSDMDTQEMLDHMDSVGLIYWPKRTKMPGFKRYLSTSPGTAMTDMVLDVPRLEGVSKEKTEYPTQKPLALYERIIKASSNPGDVVLDPFCGCATTCVAAERLGRQWVGMDIWDGAGDMVVRRIKKECALEGPDGPRQDILVPAGKITYSTAPPVRTDAGETAVPYLKPTAHTVQDSGPRIPRGELLKILLKRDGEACQGCGRTFDSPEYLEIDHKLPRADGGGNGPANRVLLCAPCNRTKSHTLTLSGLRRANKKRGFMPAAT